MPGSARRDLATLKPWEASLARSRARRRRDAARTTRRGGNSKFALVSPVSLAALIDARREAARDLAEREPWDLSLGRSRARRRASQLRFVPASSRAKRLSLGALVALTAGPAAALLDSSGGVAVAGAAPAELDPITTTSHHILLSAGSEGRQVRLLQRALGMSVDGVYGPETEAAVRRFQATRGLTVDGIVGARTSHALTVHAPPVLSGAAVLRNLAGETSEPAPGEVREEVSSPGASGTLAVAGTLEGAGSAVGSASGSAEATSGGETTGSGNGGTVAVESAGATVTAVAPEAPTEGTVASAETSSTKPAAPRSLPAQVPPPATTRRQRSSKARAAPALPGKPARKVPAKKRQMAPALVPQAERAAALAAPARNTPRPKPPRTLQPPRLSACRPRCTSAWTANSAPQPSARSAASRLPTGSRSTASPGRPPGRRSVRTASPS